MNSTVFAIHGINSSSDFVKNLSEFSNNFNLVAINLPGSKYFDLINKSSSEDICMDNWIKISIHVANMLKTKNNYLLAHSMGGGVSVRIANLEIFKKCYNVATINPTLEKSKLLKVYKQYKEPKNFVQQTLSKGLKVGIDKYQNNSDLIKYFASDDSIWRKILDENILDAYKLKELGHYYKTSRDKSTMLIGYRDYIIGTKDFFNYAMLINVPCYIIGKGHSPITTNPRDFFIFFKKEIMGKRRFFWQKLMKMPNSTYEVEE